MTVTILNITIHPDADGRYCINGLHRAAGGKAKDQPAQFMRSKGADLLKAELLKTNPNALATITKFGRSDTGTYVCKELVYAYAMWLGPEFTVSIIRSIDELPTQTDSALIERCERLQYELLAKQAQIDHLTQELMSIQPKSSNLHRFKDVISRGVGALFGIIRHPA